ncbi:hypothetical protein [Piscinibacter sp.]|uniref:hypothetical protein n=1 Tax=Piscinibacter sp. TaxID=1903157 RepID=UPI00355A99EE
MISNIRRFIASESTGLAFEGQDTAFDVQLELGVLGGSLIAALLGVALMLTPRAGSAQAARIDDDRILH